MLLKQLKDNNCYLQTNYNINDLEIYMKKKKHINKEIYQIETINKIRNNSISQVKRQQLINRVKGSVNNKGTKYLIRLVQKYSQNYSGSTLKILGGGSCINKAPKRSQREKNNTEQKMSLCQTSIHKKNKDKLQIIESSFETYQKIDNIIQKNSYFEIKKREEQIYFNEKMVSLSQSLNFIKEMLDELTLRLLKFIFIYRFLFYEEYVCDKNRFNFEEFKFSKIMAKDNIEIVYYKYLGWYHSLTNNSQNEYKNKFRDQYYYHEDLTNYENTYKQLQSHQNFQIQLISLNKIISNRISGKVKKLDISNLTTKMYVYEDKSQIGNKNIYLKRAILNWISSQKEYLIVDDIYSTESQNLFKSTVTHFNDFPIITHNIIMRFNIDFPLYIQTKQGMKELEIKNDESQTTHYDQAQQIGQLQIESPCTIKEQKFIELIQQCMEHQDMYELNLNLTFYKPSDHLWESLIISDLMIKPYNIFFNLKEESLQIYQKAMLLMNKYTQIMQINAFIKSCQSFFLFPNRILYDLYEDFELI